ncbi:hypothetical protein SAMN05444372_104120 [Flavobacterium micromati]|uniref:Uncharacterized protein n=1 Tax=Flavobacterium micromati TaxID=229205 RepID=A0A1M5IJT4_9FLAO|nr:hypothetical protein SAMN05444372_104120 [Flavobacterium micromati]
MAFTNRIRDYKAQLFMLFAVKRSLFLATTRRFGRENKIPENH